jgi:sulfate permease, SulP family
VRLTSLRRGAVIGEVGFLDNTPRSATVVAQEDLSVYVLSRETYDALCISDAEIMHQIMRNLTLDLAVRLRHTNKLALARAEV